MRKNNKQHSLYFLVLGIIIGLVICSGLLVYSYFSQSDEKQINNNAVLIKVPAVDAAGNGVVGKIRTYVEPGSGQILVNIDVLTGFLTQDSIKTAAQVASDFTNLSLDEVDITYKAEVNATAIEGPSGGAALTIATIFALQDLSLPSGIMITGTIEENGEIGTVGGILEKAKAAKADGASLFLVPQGQGTAEEINKERKCEEKEGPGFAYEYCTIQYISKKVSISEELGINVIEVSDIYEAMGYFG